MVFHREPERAYDTFSHNQDYYWFPEYILLDILFDNTFLPLPIQIMSISSRFCFCCWCNSRKNEECCECKFHRRTSAAMLLVFISTSIPFLKLSPQTNPMPPRTSAEDCYCFLLITFTRIFILSEHRYPVTFCAIQVPIITQAKNPMMIYVVDPASSPKPPPDFLGAL